VLGFYLDATLMKPVSRATPKRFLVPTAGGTKTSSLWLGDPDPVAPAITYVFDGNIAIRPSGTDAVLRVRLKRTQDTTYGFPGTPVLFAVTELQSGVAHAIQVDVQVTVQGGIVAEFVDWGLETNGYRVSGTNSATEPRTVAEAEGYMLRRDQALPQRLRLLPLGREVATALPGFQIGRYRWRDDKTINAKVLVPTKWDPNIERIGIEKFIAGIGDNDDLKPVQVEEAADSLYTRIQRGHYFTGPKGYFLPATPALEFLPAHATGHVLAQKPRATLPIFVGTYRLDGQGFYEKDIEFRTVCAVPVPDLGDDWCVVDPKTKQVTLSRALTPQTLFLGILSGNTTEYFDLPVYPVNAVTRVYLDRGLGNAPLECPNWTFDREQGTLELPRPVDYIEDGAPVYGRAGEPVYITVTPAVAVLYETDAGPTRQLPVDVNPAFAGIAGGYLYLQHRRQRVSSIVLACDKPLIAIPPTYATGYVGMVAYGPVYFDDYALLTATAYSKVSGETVPNAHLRVVVDPVKFTGLINYRDPVVQAVDVVTGGDGTANLVFIPKTGFGTYIPTIAAAGGNGGVATTTLVNDTLVLPAPVPISQIRDVHEGWLVTAYAVYNNNPLFGTVAFQPNLGMIQWTTVGTPGHADYKTNGMRDAFRHGKTLLRPIQALDAAGKNYDDPAFDGAVKRLVFGEAIPTGPTVGAYFITYVQRVTVQLKAVNSTVISNTVLLDMAVPSLIVENPWLILDDARDDADKTWDALQGTLQGALTHFRLGWQSPIPFIT
jgi:hypothetical protein